MQTASPPPSSLFLAANAASRAAAAAAHAPPPTPQQQVISALTPLPAAPCAHQSANTQSCVDAGRLQAEQQLLLLQQKEAAAAAQVEECRQMEEARTSVERACLLADAADAALVDAQRVSLSASFFLTLE